VELHWSLLRIHLDGTVASAFVDYSLEIVKAIFSEGFTETFVHLSLFSMLAYMGHTYSEIFRSILKLRSDSETRSILKLWRDSETLE